jgi:hypothetical protein
VADSSFDVVSQVDRQEIDNALNQAAKEVSTRFDFRGTGTGLAWSGEQAIEIRSTSEDRAKAALEVLREKVVKRKVSLKFLDAGEPRVSGKEVRISVAVRDGISTEHARKISKIIRDEAPKGVQVQIQGEQLRVSGKKKDDLQAVIALLRGKDLDVALQFVNFR